MGEAWRHLARVGRAGCWRGVPAPPQVGRGRIMGTRATMSAGSLLAGRYRLVEPLPGAGVGSWRARDDLGDREVTARELRRCRPRLWRRCGSARYGMREAARLRHSGIVPVYDVVEHDDAPWAVTELASEPSLDQLLRSRGPATPVETARIGLRVLEALEAADAAGVRHRDLTPANVLVGDDGQVRVTGFGLTPEPEQPPGRAAAVTGSVDFVAPERARGVSAGGIESDLWSLGATLYAAVEGRLPFHREAQLATLAAVVTDEPPPPRRAGALRAVIDGLLIKDPAHRLGLADARRMLDAVVRGVPVVPAPRRVRGAQRGGAADGGRAGGSGGTAGCGRRGRDAPSGRSGAADAGGGRGRPLRGAPGGRGGPGPGASRRRPGAGRDRCLRTRGRAPVGREGCPGSGTDRTISATPSSAEGGAGSGAAGAGSGTAGAGGSRRAGRRAGGGRGRRAGRRGSGRSRRYGRERRRSRRDWGPVRRSRRRGGRRGGSRAGAPRRQPRSRRPPPITSSSMIPRSSPRWPRSRRRSPSRSPPGRPRPRPPPRMRPPPTSSPPMSRRPRRHPRSDRRTSSTGRTGVPRHHPSRPPHAGRRPRRSPPRHPASGPHPDHPPRRHRPRARPSGPPHPDRRP